MKTKQEVKNFARRIQSASKELGYDMKLSHALEILSKAKWNQNWHTVSKRDDLFEDDNPDIFKNIPSYLKPKGDLAEFEKEVEKSKIELPEVNIDNIEEYNTIKGETKIHTTKGGLTLPYPYKEENGKMVKDESIDLKSFESKKTNKEKLGFFANLKKVLSSTENTNSINKNKMLDQKYVKNILTQLQAEGKLNGKVLGGVDLEKNSLEFYDNSNNFLFVGSMGSGKSLASRLSLMSMLMGEKDKNVFLIDLMKGAGDFKPLFHKYTKVLWKDQESLKRSYKHDSIDKILDLDSMVDALYNELNKRINLEKDSTDIGQKTSWRKQVLVFDDFHSTLSCIKFEEEHLLQEGTLAFKLYQILLKGRHYGFIIFANTCVASNHHIHDKILQCFHIRNVFKVTSGESQRLLGHDGAAKIKSSGMGECYSNLSNNKHRFLYADNKLVEELIQFI